MVQVIATLAAAVILGVSGPAETSRYAKTEFSVKVSGGTWDNPYLQEEVAMDLEFTSPDGSLLIVPCFYSGADSTWTARLAPTAEGTGFLRFVYRERGEYKAGFEDLTLEVGPSDGKGFLHPRDNWTFRFDDGTFFRGVGENLCWESRSTDDNPHLSALHEQADVYNYDVMLPKLKAHGGNFTRMWMCRWNFPIDRRSDFNNPRYEPSDEYFNPSAVLRLDHTLDLADSLGIRIMLCMGQGDVPADSAFFTDPAAKARYRDYLRYIVARWSYSTSVAAWEFFNEVDNIQFADSEKPIPAEVIVAWHTEMAGYLRGLDPYGHMITTSISHRDLDGLNDIPEIDFNQKHIYKGTAKIPAEILRYEARYAKPYVIGEAGYEWDWHKNFEDIADGLDMDFTRAMYYGLFNPTPILPMSWWWEWFDRRGTDARIAEVRSLSDQMLEAGAGSFEPLEVHVAGGDGYALRCGKQIFIYVFNPTQAPIRTFSVVLGGHKTYRRKGLDILPGQEKTFIIADL